VILHLATVPSETRVTAQEIAARRIIPRALVRRIITRLGKAGLITTTRGRDGGIALARPAREISLLDVTRAMEGEIALNTCVINPRECPLMQVCSVHEVWVEAHAQLTERLRQATFDQLARRARVLAR
jgi:Rrf2 family protein